MTAAVEMFAATFDEHACALQECATAAAEDLLAMVDFKALAEGATEGDIGSIKRALVQLFSDALEIAIDDELERREAGSEQGGAR